MKNTTLTVTFSAEKLDALVFHMERKETDLQNELNDTVQKLYEKYVPQATREYIDDKVTREAALKERNRRPNRARDSHEKMSNKARNDGDNNNNNDNNDNDGEYEEIISSFQTEPNSNQY